jgi:hypothetical protein
MGELLAQCFGAMIRPVFVSPTLAVAAAIGCGARGNCSSASTGGGSSSGCASPDTPIATLEGERPIADIQVGDVVYSVDHGAICPVLVTRIGRHRAQNHHVVRVVTADGRTLEISAPHPTADGRAFGDLRARGLLDGHVVESVEVIPYAHDYTYDIPPSSDTGMQIGSTLARSDSGTSGGRFPP